VIYCGSGSSFGKVLVLVPVPVPVQDQDLFSTVFKVNNKKFVKNLAFSVLEAALFPRKLASIFLLYCITVPVPVSLRLKFAVPPVPVSSSGFTALPSCGVY
jgi:hypothetical protein